MKKYRICLFVFLAASLLCAGTGYAVRRSYYHRAQETEETTTVSLAEESGQEVLNIGEVKNQTETVSEKPYCLVVEDGFLLVFCKEQADTCLYTHIPIMDFPPKEQEKLREGIWFDSIMEVYSYLESYTS